MINIYGRGVAALACARKLVDSDLKVCVQGNKYSSPVVLLIGEPTLQLLAETFRCDDLLKIGYPVSERVVKWNRQPCQRALAPARSVSLDQLHAHLERLTDDLEFNDQYKNIDVFFHCDIFFSRWF